MFQQACNLVLLMALVGDIHKSKGLTPGAIQAKAQ
jgi:hypothetical protein